MLSTRNGDELSDCRSTPESSSVHSQFKLLFQIWSSVERRPAMLQKNLTDEESDEFLYAQTMIMELAAALPARSLADLLYKLALWRWDTPDLDPIEGEMQRNDKVAYSVFRDLVALTGDSSVLTRDDIDSGLSIERASGGKSVNAHRRESH